MNYQTTLTTKLPSTPVMNRSIASAAKTLYRKSKNKLKNSNKSMKKNQQGQQHRELSMITTPQQNHQCQCPIYTNI